MDSCPRFSRAVEQFHSPQLRRAKFFGWFRLHMGADWQLFVLAVRYHDIGDDGELFRYPPKERARDADHEWRYFTDCGGVRPCPLVVPTVIGDGSGDYGTPF